MAYQYADKTGKLRMSTAATAEASPDIAPNSGWQQLPAPTGNSRLEASTPAATAPSATAPAAAATDPSIAAAINQTSQQRSRLQSIITAVPQKPPTEAELIAERRSQAQGLIDAVNSSFDAIIKGEQDAGGVRNDRTRALNIGAGLQGSDFASSAAEKTEAGNRKIIEAKEAERSAAIQQILYNTDNRAREDAAKLSETYKNDAEAALKAMNDQQEAARADIVGLAGLGLTAEQLKQKDSELYKNILSQSGLTEAGLKLYMAANGPKETKLGEAKIPGGMLFLYRQPNGSVRQERIDIPDLAEEEKFMIAPDGTPLVYGGSKGPRIPEGFIQGQFAKPKEPTAGDTKNTEYQQAMDFVNDNPDLKPSEYEQYIRANTNLTDGDIKSLLAQKTTLTKDYFKSVFTEEQLADAAKDAGYTVEGSGWLGMGKDGDAEAYLNYLDGLVKQYKQVGYTDEEILKMMEAEK